MSRFHNSAFIFHFFIRKNVELSADSDKTKDENFLKLLIMPLDFLKEFNVRIIDFNSRVYIIYFKLIDFPTSKVSEVRFILGMW